ncbi:hypothetical protein M409DRAFT_26289 [Zasmidium cellare ATCC 36951]|uniref:Uncharacterized protein n=1 Tax=Zasmidium cellare ATCC 36951 TaxID=1080233 RepID=A0A6A6C878_ZASCE|nr:uncharacterized protein M409DRAFT_26289 [Zasmidium cellare ATCC 36951]KAF2163245.1 hypothetical protein M409DRAFT_26289 [Zasmidium cellare ATCC 36951]
MSVRIVMVVIVFACLTKAQTTGSRDPTAAALSTILHSTPSVVAGSIVLYDPCKTEVEFIMTCPASYECSAWNNITASCTYAPTTHRCTIPMRDGNRTVSPTTKQPDTTVLIDCLYPANSKATCSTSVMGSDIDAAYSTTFVETLSDTPPSPTDIGGINSYHGVTIADGLEKMSAGTASCTSRSTGMAARATAMRKVHKVLVPVGAAAMVGVVI